MPELASNKKALFDYELLEKFEAGLVLTGQEVKSIKGGHINLKGAFVTIKANSKTKRPEAYLTNARVSPYKPAGSLPDYDPERPRRLLLHNKELNHLLGKSQVKGLTIVPIKVYTKHKLIKIEFAIARGKKQHDKRETIKKREVDRQIRRALKNN